MNWNYHKIIYFASIDINKCGYLITQLIYYFSIGHFELYCLSSLIWEETAIHYLEVPSQTDRRTVSLRSRCLILFYIHEVYHVAFVQSCLVFIYSNEVTYWSMLIRWPILNYANQLSHLNYANQFLNLTFSNWDFNHNLCKWSRCFHRELCKSCISSCIVPIRCLCLNYTNQTSHLALYIMQMRCLT